ncbi:MAG: DUF3575 domain-containing protein [Cyclobacteriaceae bacterium]
MRYILLFIFVFCLNLVGFSMVHPLDSNYVKARILKINIFSPIVDIFNVAFETTTGPETSLQTGIFVGVGAFGFTPEFRYYLGEKPAPHGTYIAPFLRYQKYDFVGEKLGGGLIIGYQGYFKQKITIDAFIGPSYNTFIVDEELLNFGIRAGVTVGINLVRRKR